MNSNVSITIAGLESWGRIDRDPYGASIINAWEKSVGEGAASNKNNMSPWTRDAVREFMHVIDDESWCEAAPGFAGILVGWKYLDSYSRERVKDSLIMECVRAVSMADAPSIIRVAEMFSAGLAGESCSRSEFIAIGELLMVYGRNIRDEMFTLQPGDRARHERLSDSIHIAWVAAMIGAHGESGPSGNGLWVLVRLCGRELHERHRSSHGDEDPFVRLCTKFQMAAKKEISIRRPRLRGEKKWGRNEVMELNATLGRISP